MTFKVSLFAKRIRVILEAPASSGQILQNSKSEISSESEKSLFAINASCLLSLRQKFLYVKKGLNENDNRGQFLNIFRKRKIVLHRASLRIVKPWLKKNR